MTTPKEALEFYAHPANWTDTPSWDGDPDNTTPKAIPILRNEEGHPCDCGDTARKALAALDASTAGAWRYEIKYGPEGEANYAWVYDADGEMVCTAKTHHAEAIVTRMNATASLQGEDVVDRVARIIDPDAWRYVDDATRPYAENRGSSNGNGGENYWYERTCRAGCRSVNDVRKWLFERTLTPADPIHITHIRESVAKARAILATGLVPDESTIRADEREKCARELETSYPDHAWLNAACAAIRSGGGD